MHQIDIKSIDLNLLIILKILLDENNVTKASEKLNLSQSATSHALNRLRKMFNDPLLERSRTGMRPTARALALQGSLKNILLEIEQLVAEPIFRPEVATGTVRIAASDYGTTVILPSVLKQLARESPYINIECYDWHPDTMEKLGIGEIDLALGVAHFDDNDNQFRSQKLFPESFASVVRADHPIIQDSITLESYISWSHALITITGTPSTSIKKSHKSHVDRILEESGVTRRVMLKLPHFLSAALIIDRTDLILTLPRRIALLFTNIANIAVFEPPLDLGVYEYMQVWHARCDNIPLQAWIRNIIASQTQDI
jgi:DNA-binding transcriptional LysR family regulator